VDGQNQALKPVIFQVAKAHRFDLGTVFSAMQNQVNLGATIEICQVRGPRIADIRVKHS
jgi:hypothetical protein